MAGPFHSLIHCLRNIYSIIMHRIFVYFSLLLYYHHQILTGISSFIILVDLAKDYLSSQRSFSAIYCTFSDVHSLEKGPFFSGHPFMSRICLPRMGVFRDLIICDKSPFHHSITQNNQLVYKGEILLMPLIAWLTWNNVAGSNSGLLNVLAHMS